MMTETTTFTADSPLLQAMTGHRPTVTPVWFMRQAGRSLPEYREAREGTTMLESCLNPELAAEITCQLCAATTSTGPFSTPTSWCR
ncbi:uroporphyrinogen III decarboxylase [Cutibacterium acnes JCM 18909]|nr:uroporphyrinogen III decarboxylase [Cutibacterium acnes JCM 18909]